MKSIILQIIKLIRAFFKKKIEAPPRHVHIVDLAAAMARFEGYYIPHSRAWRNNNPLNLRWSRFSKVLDSAGFCRFVSARKGWKAGLWDLRRKCKGHTRTSLKPTSTVCDLIFVWSVTDQESYADFVCERLKIPLDYQLKEFDLSEIGLPLGE